MEAPVDPFVRSTGEAARATEDAPGAPDASSTVLRPAGSLWGPVLLRSAGVAVLLATLAGIGALSIRLGLDQGIPLDPALAARAAESWLAPGNARSARASLSPRTTTERATLDGAVAATSALTSPTASSSAAPSASAGTPAAAITADGKVILNRAGLAELRRIPGVGEKRAAAILELRARLGRFRKATDLLRVRGLGTRSLTRMREHFVLDAPESASSAAPSSAAPSSSAAPPGSMPREASR